MKLTFANSVFVSLQAGGCTFERSIELHRWLVGFVQNPVFFGRKFWNCCQFDAYDWGGDILIVSPNSNGYVIKNTGNYLIVI